MSKKHSDHGPDLTAADPVTETPESELTRLRALLKATEDRIFELEHPIVEFPKMVNGREFASRAEQDAAGPEFVDTGVTNG